MHISKELLVTVLVGGRVFLAAPGLAADAPSNNSAPVTHSVVVVAE